MLPCSSFQSTVVSTNNANAAVSYLHDAVADEYKKETTEAQDRKKRNYS